MAKKKNQHQADFAHDPIEAARAAGAFIATADNPTGSPVLPEPNPLPAAAETASSAGLGATNGAELRTDPQQQSAPADRAPQAAKRAASRLGKLSFARVFFLALAVVLPAFILFNAPAAYKAFLSLTTMLRPFIIGAALAFLVKIPMNVLEHGLERILPSRFKKLKRPLALLLTLALIALLITLCLRLILPQIIQSVLTLEKNSQAFALKLAEYLEKNDLTAPYGEDIRNYMQGFNWQKLLEGLGDYLKQGSSAVLRQAISTTSAIATGTTNGIFALFFMLYVLVGKERLSRQGRRLLYAYLPEKQADNTLYVAQLLHDNFAAFIGGQFLDAVMIAAWSYLGVIIVGLPGLLIVPVIMGVTDLVPLIGPIVGTVLATLVVVIDSPLKALGLLIYLLIVQQIQGNVIYPKLVGDRLGLPAMWTLVAVSLGGSLLGIVGMWIFCPLFAVIYLLLDQDSQRKIDAKKIALEQKDGPTLLAVRHSNIEEHPEYCDIETEVSQVGSFFTKLKDKFKQRRAK
ncbi:MAG: AI-2E family transporter [Eubacteriales bacterium]|nr:AI-2E family transporter [Eubacteriales bacterium]